MNFLQVLLIVGALWSTDWVHGFDCVDLMSEEQKCFQKYGLSFPESLKSDVITICSPGNRKAFENGLRCVAAATRKCAPVAGISLDHTIEGNTAVSGVEYLCDRLTSLDTDCMKRSRPAIVRCITEGLKHSTYGSAESKICGISSLERGCHEKMYGKCSEQTLKIWTHYSLTYDTPPACRGESGVINEYHVKAPQPNPDLVHTSDCTNVKQDVLKCFDRTEGLTLKSDLRTICSFDKEGEFKDAVRCAAAVTRNCAPVARISRDHTIDPNTAATGVDYLCDRIEYLDTACMKASTPSIASCIKEGLYDIRDEDAEDADSKICALASLERGCHERMYGKCSGQTSKIWTNYSLTYDTPPACRGGTNTLTPTLVLLAATLLATIACWIRTEPPSF